MALGRKTGGRTKGTPNKSSLTAIEIVRNSGKDPIQVLCDLMVNSVDEIMKFQAAKELAQYVYQKRSQQIDVSGKITHEMQQRIEQLSELSDAELDKVIEIEAKKINE